MTPSSPDVHGLRAQRSATPQADAADAVPRPTRRLATRVVLPAGLLLAFLLLLGFAGRDVILPRTEVRAIEVVARAGEGVASSSSVAAQAAGWVEPDPYPVYATALTDGVVDEILVLEGETVKKGQLLARLVDDDARLALDRAVAELASRAGAVGVAQATFSAAQRIWDEPVDRDRALAEADSQVDEAEAAIAELEKLVKAQVGEVARISDRLEREREELIAGAVTGYEVIQTELELGSARDRLEALQERGPVLAARLAGALARQKAAKRHLELRIEEKQALEESRAALVRAKAEHDHAKAVRDEAELRLERMEVRATMDGAVMQRLAAPGGKVMLGMDSPHSAHIVHLYDPDKLQVRVDIPLADAAGIGVGQGAEVIVEVLPNRVFKGRVTRVVHEADVQKNTLQVKVAIEDPDPELKPEMLARVRLLAVAAESDGPQSRLDQVWAPEELLGGRAGDRAVAWVVDEGADVARRRDVQVGSARTDGWVHVVSGLQVGDAIIDARAIELDDGDRVEVVGEPVGGSWR